MASQIRAGEKRGELNARNAANYKSSGPTPNGSFVPPEDTSDDLLATRDANGIDLGVIYPGVCMCPNEEIARVVDDHDNVRFNTSRTLPEHLSEAVRRIGAELHLLRGRPVCA